MSVAAQNNETGRIGISDLYPVATSIVLCDGESAKALVCRQLTAGRVSEIVGDESDGRDRVVSGKDALLLEEPEQFTLLSWVLKEAANSSLLRLSWTVRIVQDELGDGAND